MQDIFLAMRIKCEMHVCRFDKSKGSLIHHDFKSRTLDIFFLLTKHNTIQYYTTQMKHLQTSLTPTIPFIINSISLSPTNNTFQISLPTTISTITTIPISKLEIHWGQKPKSQLKTPLARNSVSATIFEYLSSQSQPPCHTTRLSGLGLNLAAE